MLLLRCTPEYSPHPKTSILAENLVKSVILTVSHLATAMLDSLRTLALSEVHGVATAFATTKEIYALSS